MDYLMTAKGLRQLDALAGGKTLYAFDFDGTLARIVRDHTSAQLTRPIRVWLGALAKRAPTAIISGRSVEDLRARVGGAVPYLVGNHGLEGLQAAPRVSQQAMVTCAAWRQQVQDTFGKGLAGAGVSVEDKTYSLAFHYRNAGRRQAARDYVFRILAQLNPLPRIVLGKSVVNVVPAAAPHKGAALLELMHQLIVMTALYVGDDDTDEDVFSLPDPRLLTVRVGKKTTSAARFFLKSQTEITQLLRYLVKALDTRHGTSCPPTGSG
ncbi:MAG: trehalose-phosphatase, partial [Nitrospiraceae bacterium]